MFLFLTTTGFSEYSGDEAHPIHDRLMNSPLFRTSPNYPEMAVFLYRLQPTIPHMQIRSTICGQVDR